MYFHTNFHMPASLLTVIIMKANTDFVQQLVVVLCNDEKLYTSCIFFHTMSEQILFIYHMICRQKSDKTHVA
jgi:hypothetical protein